MNYVGALSEELARVGIGGRLHRRILAEIGDHLESDPEAALGDPADLARQFADELGTARARRGAYAAFAVLVFAAAVLGASWLGSKATGLAWPRVHPPSRILADVAFALVVIGSQVAFVSGVLAAGRALRHRGALVLPRAEATVITRRALVALLAGIGTMAGVALIAVELHVGQPSWWMPATLAGAVVGLCLLIGAASVALAALRTRPAADGQAGDVFADLGPLAPPPLRGRPWAFALTVAAAVAVVITLAGVLQSDGYDGALRGLADGAACLAGFAVLGRYLGLRTTTGGS